MSAMPALDWPDDDPASETASTWTFPDWLRPAETARGHASGDQAPRGQAVRVPAAREHAVRVPAIRSAAAHDPAVSTPVTRGQAAGARAVHGQAARGQAPRGAAAPAPLRLTRRGRIVVAAAAALLVTLLSLLLTGGAWATSTSGPSHGADRSLAQVVVLPGQSLWSVAQTADPNADPRQVMQQIIDLNSLAGDVIQAGQRLWVPRG
jgi:LysM domain-containing protein